MLSELMRRHKSVDVSKMRAGDFLGRQNEIELVKIEGIERNSGWKEVPACPVCGGPEHQAEFSKHGVEIVGCPNCDTRYGKRIPANLDDVYQNPNYVLFSKDEEQGHFEYRRERFGRERVGILEEHCGDLTDKRIIDVGCGNGYFLSVAMEKSRHCFGAEFSDKLREFTKEVTGLPVFGEGLDDLPEKGFDILTLFDVIEHIPEPIPFMESVDRILNPGGSVLIFTPNFDSFSVKVNKEYSSIVDPTEHVVLYTLSSLRFLAHRVGYEVVYAETQGLDVQNVLAMLNYAEEGSNEFLRRWNNELQAMIDASQCGDYGRIMLRKPL